MLILNVINNGGLACDCGVSRVSIMTYHQLCKKYFPKKMGCINSVLFLVKSIIIYELRRIIEQIYRNTCLLICKLITMAYVLRGTL